MVLQLLRFSVLVSLVGLPFILDARTVEERPKVLVSVFNNAGVDDATVLLAEKMASQIYEQAGLSIIWKNCLAQAEPKRERCIQTVDKGISCCTLSIGPGPWRPTSTASPSSVRMARESSVMSFMIQSQSCTAAAGLVRQRFWLSLPHMNWVICCSAHIRSPHRTLRLRVPSMGFLTITNCPIDRHDFG